MKEIAKKTQQILANFNKENEKEASLVLTCAFLFKKELRVHHHIFLLPPCFLGGYFVYQSFNKIKRMDHTIREIKMKKECTYNILED